MIRIRRSLRDLAKMPATIEPGAIQESEQYPSLERIGFWVQFAFGASWGFFLSFGLLLRLYQHPGLLLASSSALILGCGYAAGRLGDNFWTKVVSHRWFWW
jgi:hypothetical protein